MQFASHLHLRESARKNLHGITKSLKAIKLLQCKNANENNGGNLVVHAKHESEKYFVEMHTDENLYENALSNLKKNTFTAHLSLPVTNPEVLLWKYIC